MKVLLSRLKLRTNMLEHTTVVAMILLSNYQLSASVAERPRRPAAITLLFLVAALWRCCSSARPLMPDAHSEDHPRPASAIRRTDPRPRIAASSRSRALFISDVHLGTAECQADLLVYFLRSRDVEALFLVGDIVDAWRLKSNWYWPKAHTDVLQELLCQARRVHRPTFWFFQASPTPLRS